MQTKPVNSIELNGTYYKIPAAEQMRKMIERSQKRLVFTIKAFQGLTHTFYQDSSQYKLLTGEFKKALEPLLIVQLFFNNHAKSQAVINAKKIDILLKGQ